MSGIRVFADDEEVPLMTYRDVDPAVVAADGQLGDFREEAVSAQRLAVSRLVRKYVPGRMELAVPDQARRMSPEKMFNMAKLIDWVDGDPEIVVEALQAGRLRCRLNAAMGLGKSTRLASYVARVMNMRVLHVALDAHALQQMAVYIRDRGIGRISRSWPRKPGMAVCCMTYADFNGHMMTSRRSNLFRTFDLIIFDEAFVSSADVFVAKKCFSTYSLPDNNLILCSATIRSDVAKEDMGSQFMGSFKETRTVVSLDDAISSGKLVTDYLTDRSIFFLATNDQVYRANDYYIRNGVDSKVIDDADSYEQLRACYSWLEGDSTTPRVVVAHVSWAIAYNLPVSYVLLSPYEAVRVIEGEEIREEFVAMSDEMVAQAKARTGRGIVDGSGGVVLSPERVGAVELSDSERMRAFVTLCAASIKPLSTSFWDRCYERFPEALTPIVAQTILKVCLPVEVVAKYLGADGRIASRYVRALTAFSQPDHFPMPSESEFPVCFDSWVVDKCEVVAGLDEEFRVPFRTSGELKTVLVAVEMMAQGRIDIPRWRPARAFAMGDGYDSEEEEKDPRYSSRVQRLRRVEDPVVITVPEPSVVRTIPWEFRPLIEDGVSTRQGGFINSERCRQALLELEQSLQEYAVPEPKVSEVIESAEGTVTPIHADGYGQVESPGGSVVCVLPVGICEKMNTGKSLLRDEFVRVISAARCDIDRFVASKLFDCFSGPWESILRSLLVDSVASQVVRLGIAGDTYLLVDRLRARFGLELCSVMANSYVFKRKFLKVFRMTPSVDSMMRAIREGRFDGVAQTDAFIDRVKDLKELIDSVLLAAEKQNVFVPTYITNAQRSLPLRGQSRLGCLGQNVHEMPVKISRRLEQSADGHKRDCSFDSKRAGW